MIKAMLEWLLSFFSTDKKLSALEKKKKHQEDKLEEIEDENTDIDDVIDRLNK